MDGPINRIVKLFTVHSCKHTRMYRYPLNKLICKKMMKTQDDDLKKVIFYKILKYFEI